MGKSWEGMDYGGLADFTLDFALGGALRAIASGTSWWNFRPWPAEIDHYILASVLSPIYLSISGPLFRPGFVAPPRISSASTASSRLARTKNRLRLLVKLYRTQDTSLIAILASENRALRQGGRRYGNEAGGTGYGLACHGGGRGSSRDT